MLSSWKTTLGGILAAGGTFLIAQEGIAHLIGQILQAIGLFLLGVSAQDTVKNS
jgi:hypothetical protein